MDDTCNIYFSVKNCDTEKVREILPKLDQYEEVEDDNTTTFISYNICEVLKNVIVPLAKKGITLLGMFHCEDIECINMVAVIHKEVIGISKTFSGGALSPIDMVRKYEKIATEINTYFESTMVHCKFCGKETPTSNIYIHQDNYVCADCWDDRLIATA